MMQGIKTIMDFSFGLEKGRKASPSVTVCVDIPLSVMYVSLSSLALKTEKYTLSKGLELFVKDC